MNFFSFSVKKSFFSKKKFKKKYFFQLSFATNEQPYTKGTALREKPHNLTERFNDKKNVQNHSQNQLFPIVNRLVFSRVFYIHRNLGNAKEISF